MEKTLIKLGELFCGPGGLAVGATTAENSKFKIIHAWANDFDENTCETYRTNICPDDPDSVICQNVRELDISKLGEIDALAFGFPCNSFSQVSEHQGLENEKYGELYTFGVKALKIYQPKWFLAENVSGITSANEGNALKIIMQDMKNAGYRLYPHMYYFEDYGIPQARHRMIIVGIRNDLPYEFKIPKPSMKYKTCKEAIENPPIPDWATNNNKTKQSATVVERLTYIKPGENAFNADLPEHLKLKVKGAKISQIYKRLDPNKPAYTVTGSGGGGTHMYHWEEPRALTNRERARIQTFPDTYKFVGNNEAVRKQIGMAVPCEGARIIFEAILNTFAGQKYDYIDSNLKEYEM